MSHHIELLAFHIVLLLVLLLLCNNVNSESPPCAILRSTTNPWKDNPLILRDDSVIGNLADEYVTKEKNWNISAFWSVNPSCHLKTCNDVYLTGSCNSISGEAQSSSQIWLSARCKCDSQCQCSNVIIKHSVCAHAYFQPGGCNNCNVPYTELNPGSHDTFPDVWTGNVSSFLVRKGCSLTVYDEEDLEGNPEIVSGFGFKEWSNPVGSYECDCDDDIDEVRITVPTVDPSSTPRKFEIPDTMEDVMTKLIENNFNHSGLFAALSSLAHGRSSKNAYLLMIGSTGAGKSSASNNLLGRDLTPVGSSSSTTSEILEFRIPVPIPEHGIGNSELRIIDTPGLLDTRGIEKDALFLATLDDYLSNHEELKDKLPNFVLIFHNFHDNRFDGEGSQFVRMVRGLETIRDRITDENFSNVLFVFSHLCSLDKRVQRNPLPRLMKFRDVVDRYSFFPKPILATVIENRGAENELVMRNGNVELPNQELFTQNLFQKLDAITRGGGDGMGNAIVNANSLRGQLLTAPYLNINRVIYPLVSSTHAKVSKHLNMLQLASYSLNSSEVSIELSQLYENLNSSMKSQVPQGLEKVQRYLNLKNIKTKRDVPRTTTAILDLLSGVDQNEAISYLLEVGLDLRAPVFPVNTVTGYGFDIRKNSYLSASPFRMQDYRSSNIGFRLPKIIHCTKSSPSPQPPVTIYKEFPSKQAYFQNLIASLLPDKLRSSTNSTEIFSALTRKLEDGYFVSEMASCTSIPTSYCFTISRFYKTFEFNLEPPKSNTSYLESRFARLVENLAALDVSSYESVEQWNNFFDEFGTHVVTSAEGGGQIDIHFTLPTHVPMTPTIDKVLKCLEFVEDPLGSFKSYKESSKTAFTACSNINHKLTFRGGNPAYHVSDVSKLSLEVARRLLENWKKSLRLYPAVFSRQISPMGEVIGKYFHVWDQAGIKRKNEMSISRLLSSTLKYFPPSPDPRALAAREEEEERLRKVMEEHRKQNAEMMNRLKAERKRKKEEADKLKKAEIETRQRIVEEQRERVEERIREKEVFARQRQQELEQRRSG